MIYFLFKKNVAISLGAFSPFSLKTVVIQWKLELMYQTKILSMKFKRYLYEKKKTTFKMPVFMSDVRIKRNSE